MKQSENGWSNHTGWAWQQSDLVSECLEDYTFCGRRKGGENERIIQTKKRQSSLNCCEQQMRFLISKERLKIFESNSNFVLKIRLNIETAKAPKLELKLGTSLGNPIQHRTDNGERITEVSELQTPRPQTHNTRAKLSQVFKWEVSVQKHWSSNWKEISCWRSWWANKSVPCCVFSLVRISPCHSEATQIMCDESYILHIENSSTLAVCFSNRGRCHRIENSKQSTSSAKSSSNRGPWACLQPRASCLAALWIWKNDEEPQVSALGRTKKDHLGSSLGAAPSPAEVGGGVEGMSWSARSAALILLPPRSCVVPPASPPLHPTPALRPPPPTRLPPPSPRPPLLPPLDTAVPDVRRARARPRGRSSTAAASEYCQNAESEVASQSRTSRCGQRQPAASGRCPWWCRYLRRSSISCLTLALGLQTAGIESV